MSHVHIGRLSRIRDQSDAARLALESTINRWNSPEIQQSMQNVSFNAITFALSEIEVTYQVRLFSEFESILREYLVDDLGIRINDKTGVATVINRVTSRLKIESAIHIGAQNVRQNRNKIVHYAGRTVTTLSFVDAMSALNRYLVRL
jgi:hypothetical protein